MPHRSIALVVAMRREVAPLLVGIRVRQIDGVDFYELENAVVAVGGIGRQSARKAATVLLERYTAKVLVSAGIAGALTPQLKVGDVVRAHEVVDGDSGIRVVTRGGEGSVVTVTSVSGAAEKRVLAARWSAAVVDMEASAVAEVAQRYGREFAAVKSISDELDFEMPPVARFVNEAGKFETLRFAVFLAIRPKWWGPVKRLSANSRVAAVNLSQVLQHLIEQGLKVPDGERVFGA